ncbi:glutathione S-transferase [Gaertneriomyces semiglobifer]|nr:glutathione S-transferase [Gaertneriomyces semiglobifer]
MGLTFYYAPNSTAVSTAAALAELDVPHEVKLTELGPNGTKSEAFAKINPNGTVPTIEHDGTVIWESAAIAIYLGETFGVEKGLFPAPGPKRGEALKWIVWSNTVFGVGPMKIYEGNEAGGKEILTKAFRILDEQLKRGHYLLGDKYSLADTHLFTFVFWVEMMKLDMMASHPNVEAWYKRVTERPALKKVLGSK